MPGFVIVFDDDSGRYPVHNSTDDTKAVSLFQTRELAQRFCDEAPHAEPWRIEDKSNHEDLAAWLRSALTNDGVTELALNPDPSTYRIAGSTRVIPIFAFLVKIEK